MVPVLDRAGQPAELPRNTANRYGYALEFDSRGRLGNLTIDFEAIAEHLLQLRKSASKHGISIQRVIFDPPFMSSLLASRAGPSLSRTIPFMQGKPWIRHDEHYHVDFNVPCLPLSTFGVAGKR
jgi:penicillin-insensitive murein endopeptidase